MCLTYENTQLQKKRALRIIHNMRFLDHTHPLFIHSKMLKFYDLVHYLMSTSIKHFTNYYQLTCINFHIKRSRSC